MKFLQILKVILIGIIEGITEWLPVSSTGHMILFDSFFPLDMSAEFKEMFLVVIQLGAILAVVVLFWKKLFPFHFREKPAVDQGILKLWGKVLIACLPAGIIGILLDDFLEAKLHTPLVIAAMLILYGVAFLIVEKKNKNRIPRVETTDDIDWKTALIIGGFQVLSLIPGTSRSGATILGAILVGVSRPAAAEFTFFLAIPVMAGASVIKIAKFVFAGGGFGGTETAVLLLGCAVAFAVSLLAVKFLMGFVKKHNFSPFGWYRIVLGLIVIATALAGLL